jgi:hypothetical protein
VDVTGKRKETILIEIKDICSTKEFSFPVMKVCPETY